MEEEKTNTNTGVSLPLSSLRLLVPPLHLMSAFMWQVLQQKSVIYYGRLEEFVSMVTETLPQVLSYRQGAQLRLGLRARMVLELCRSTADFRNIQAHLDRIQIPAATPLESIDADVRPAVANFKALVLALLKNPVEKAYFFQEVFPVEYGAKYDTALKELMWDLLSRLEKLFPVPDFRKTLSWLTIPPAHLEDCMQTNPKDLHVLLLQQHQLFGGSETQSSKPRSVPHSSGDCIFSTLSIPPSARVVIAAEPVVYHVQTSGVALLSSATLGQLGSDTIIVTDYTEVELSSQEMLVGEAEAGGCVEEKVKMLLVKGCDVREPESLEEAASFMHDKTTQRAVACEVVSDAKATTSCDELAIPHNEESLQEVYTGETGQLNAQDEDNSANISPVAGTDLSVVQEFTAPPVTDVVQTTETRRGPGRARKRAGATDKNVVKTLRRRGRPIKQITTEKRSVGEPHGVIADAEGQMSSRSDMRQKESNSSGSHPEQTSGATKPTNPMPANKARARHLCDTCGRTFTRRSDVRRHQLTHTGERPFHCSQCDKTFQHAWDLTRHCRKMHGKTAFVCQLCHSNFGNLRILAAHHKKSHSGELPHYCSICGEASLTAAALIQHRKTHSAKQQYLCEQCGEGFDTLLQRSVHRQSHRRLQQFKCPQCDKMYTRRTDVKRHLLSHTGERPHQCSICGKRFSLRAGLQKHLITHSHERPFQCPHCPKSFRQPSILHRHERMHTGERPYLCSQCGKGFLSHGELIKHGRTHTEERPYSCPQCRKGFKSKRALQEHVSSHSGARPYPCNFCGKMFAKPFALNRHYLIHTGERPFSCAHCDRAFLTFSELALHERVHTGERPYCCTVCPRKFRSSSELARHRRSHSMDRPHTCGYCPKAYTCATKLKNHIRIHTGESKPRRSVGSKPTAGAPETNVRVPIEKMTES
ncbi:uncharacterized protein [Paramisgurnus dabryanus]|uniref:uncharacterized protein n=1 Tax=Paramisgurnus dabryanus TaxID=90735 RepID=UPI0031F373D8